MKITVDKSLLKKAIAVTKQALSKVIIQEERGHLLFKVIGDKMVVKATNSDLKSAVVLDIENNSKEDDSFTADPKLLSKLLIKVDLDELRLDYNRESHILKVYTGTGEKSYTSLNSFPPDKMLSFNNEMKPPYEEWTVPSSVLVSALKYSLGYLASLKEDRRQFDYVVIQKGIVFASNGGNKMGFIVYKAFEKVRDFRIRKAVVPLFISFLNTLKQDDAVLFETDRDVGMLSTDRRYRYSSLKSVMDAPPMPINHLKSVEPYTSINKSDLLKNLDRIVVTRPAGAVKGIEMVLSGTGDDGILELRLVSDLDTREQIPCKRVGDDGKELSHVVDYTIFRSELASFSSKEIVRLHINEPTKAFKIYDAGETEGHKYMAAGIGAYSKVKRH